MWYHHAEKKDTQYIRTVYPSTKAIYEQMNKKWKRRTAFTIGHAVSYQLSFLIKSELRLQKNVRTHWMHVFYVIFFIRKIDFDDFQVYCIPNVVWRIILVTWLNPGWEYVIVYLRACGRVCKTTYFWTWIKSSQVLSMKQKFHSLKDQFFNSS